MLSGSLAIDRGSNDAYNRWRGPLFDFKGNSRIINQVIDLGAIEYR
ncbi:choice-of-anchor Q domain-containing protein [Spirosoma radiotolerans]